MQHTACAQGAANELALGLAVSAASVATATCFTNPFDVVKVHLQLTSRSGLQGGARPGVSSVVSDLLQTQAWLPPPPLPCRRPSALRALAQPAAPCAARRRGRQPSSGVWAPAWRAQGACGGGPSGGRCCVGAPAPAAVSPGCRAVAGFTEASGSACTSR